MGIIIGIICVSTSRVFQYEPLNFEGTVCSITSYIFMTPSWNWHPNDRNNFNYKKLYPWEQRWHTKILLGQFFKFAFFLSCIFCPEILCYLLIVNKLCFSISEFVAILFAIHWPRNTLLTQWLGEYKRLQHRVKYSREVTEIE